MNIEVISSYGSNAFSSLLQWGGGGAKKKANFEGKKARGAFPTVQGRNFAAISGAESVH